MIMKLFDRMTDMSVLVCTALTVIIPWGIHRINWLLHQYGDPPWKQHDSYSHSSEGQEQMRAQK